MDRSSRKPAIPAATTSEYWHLNGFNMCEIIVIRDGPAPDGTKYVDGRHAISVAVFESVEDAALAVKRHNVTIQTGLVFK